MKFAFNLVMSFLVFSGSAAVAAPQYDSPQRDSRVEAEKLRTLIEDVKTGLDSAGSSVLCAESDLVLNKVLRSLDQQVMTLPLPLTKEKSFLGMCLVVNKK